ncbi:MAG: hypothetical protein LIP03_15315 [Bacteroidales bacterium]|nr:hypothetical protein [Bacteroidales bacterium]
MEKIIVQIGASDDHYGAFAINADGIYGAGDTIEDCKADVIESIRLIKENLPKSQWPELLQSESGFDIEWKYDTQTLLQHFAGIFTNAALERLTGINQKQLWNYANGISKPRAAARKKIQSALNNLGKELVTLSL